MIGCTYGPPGMAVVLQLHLVEVKRLIAGGRGGPSEGDRRPCPRLERGADPSAQSGGGGMSPGCSFGRISAVISSIRRLLGRRHSSSCGGWTGKRSPRGGSRFSLLLGVANGPGTSILAVRPRSPAGCGAAGGTLPAEAAPGTTAFLLNSPSGSTNCPASAVFSPGGGASGTSSTVGRPKPADASAAAGMTRVTERDSCAEMEANAASPQPGWAWYPRRVLGWEAVPVRR